MIFWKWRGQGGKGHWELFWKFIRFCGVIRPQEPMNNDKDCRLGKLTNIMPNCKWYRKTFKCILSTTVYVWTRVPLSRHQVYPIWEAQTPEGYLEKSSNWGRSSSSDSFHPLIFCKGGGDHFEKNFLPFGCANNCMQMWREGELMNDYGRFQIVESISVLIKTESIPPTEFTHKHISSSFHFGWGLVGKWLIAKVLFHDMFENHLQLDSWFLILNLRNMKRKFTQEKIIIQIFIFGLF